MIKYINIGKLHIVVVVKNRWVENKIRPLSSEFNGYELGIWFRRYKIVGAKNFNNPREWSNNMVNGYIFGIKLLVFKIFVKFNFGGMYFKEN